MYLNDPIIKQELKKLSLSKSGFANYRYEAVFTDKDNNTLPVMKVLHVHINSDYVGALTDCTVLRLQCTRNVHRRVQAVNRRQLKLRLMRVPTDPHGNADMISSKQVNTYQAFLVDTTIESLEARSGEFVGPRVQDLAGLVEFDVEVVNEALIEFKSTTVGGVYRHQTLKGLIQSLMGTPMRSLSQNMDVGFCVSMQDTINNKSYYQYVLPSGTSLIDLPLTIQEKDGLYPAGVNRYLSGGIWHVYSPYNYNLFNLTDRTLTIYNIPKTDMGGITKSFYKKGDRLTVFATGYSKHLNPNEKLTNVNGTTLRMNKSGNTVNHAVHTNKGVPVRDPKDVVNLKLDDRDSDYDVVTRPKDSSSSNNPWKESEKILSSLGSMVVVTWEASNSFALNPGMPVRFIFKGNNSFHSLYGTLIASKTVISTDRKIATDNRYVSNTALTVFLEPLREEAPPPKTKAVEQILPF